MKHIYTRTLRQLGGSLCITIPAQIRHRLDLKTAQEVILESESNTLIVTLIPPEPPKGKPHHETHSKTKN